MIRIITVLAITVLSIQNLKAQETFSITANFSGIKTDKGEIYVALYNSEDSFLKEPYKGTVVKIENLKSKVEFKNVPLGNYAVSAFHDLNNNKKLDTNFFGIPKEPIGTSNDAKGFMGPPKFKKAKFLVKKDITINIKIADIF